jgi:hypothetical protein
VRLFVLIMLLAAGAVGAQPDPRYCGQPARNADGSIKRSTYQRSLFVRMHPCPATGQVTGACPGWAVDHIIPLASCGCDAPANMQWLPNEIKSAPGEFSKDRWERKVYVCPVQP